MSKRKEVIELYDSLIEATEIKATPLKHYKMNSKSSGHLYLLKLDGKSEEFRNKLITKMAEKGITTNVHYKPLPMHTAYKKLGFKIDDYPNSYAMYQNEITLPLHTLLTTEDVKYVVDSLEASYNELIR